MSSSEGLRDTLRTHFTSPNIHDMQATSIHIRPCNVDSAEEHNQRLKPLDYVRKDLSNLNECWTNGQTLSERLEQIKTIVKSKTGRKLQAKATPIREGVIVINRNTTLSDIQSFANRCSAEFGITPLQISIHKDEGHYDREKNWKPNLHAHIIFDWTNHDTGRSCKLSKQDMARMQDILAEELEMDRGISSDKKHLNSIAYKAEQIKKDIAEIGITNVEELHDLKEMVTEAREKAETSLDCIINENTTKVLGIYPKIDYKAIVEDIKERNRCVSVISSQLTYSERNELERYRKAELNYNSSMKRKDEEIKSYQDIITELLGQKFKRFVDDCNKFKKILISFMHQFHMWHGTVYTSNSPLFSGHKLSADREQGKLLIDGKTIEEMQISERLKRSKGRRL